MVNKWAKKLWEELADVPIDSNDRIEEEFLAFGEGTPREDIWHWFEETYNLSVAEDLMGLGNKKQSDTDTPTPTQESGANEMKFESLGIKERKLLLEILDVGTENLKCQYCGKAVDYKTCSILPTQSNDKNTIIACGSILCITEYLTDEEDESGN